MRIKQILAEGSAGGHASLAWEEVLSPLVEGGVGVNKLDSVSSLYYSKLQFNSTLKHLHNAQYGDRHTVYLFIETVKTNSPKLFL